MSGLYLKNDDFVSTYDLGVSLGGIGTRVNWSGTWCEMFFDEHRIAHCLVTLDVC